MNVKERFLNYVAYPTMSDEESQTIPSTEKQLKLAERLVQDMQDMGLRAHCDQYGYVYGELDANTDKIKESIGFIAHMDTSSEASDTNIKAKEVLFDGNDIVLNEQDNIILSVSFYPDIMKYKGETLIVTDGTTLLGADDKAGIAEILTAVETVIENNIPHGAIKIAFTPDEEIGRGADKFDVKGFGADFAYTVDGGAIGELEYENFNAAAAKVIIHGVSIHPGSAKNKMKNAALIAMEFDAMLPQDELPSNTEGYEGFHHLTAMKGNVEHAELSYIIRDHDMTKFEEKKHQLEAAAKALNEKYGSGTVELTVTDSYYNMKSIIEQNMYIVERAKNAMIKEGITPKIIPIRGGTDGARLSFMGLPCPNICTGGENFHSRFEYVPVSSLEKISSVIVNIIKGE